jgi:putative membrane protein
VVLSDHGQTQGATFKQRNGYDLQALVERSIEAGSVAQLGGGDENDFAATHALSEATGRKQHSEAGEVADRRVIVLASGNLGLIYLMDSQKRLSLEEIDELHPRLISSLREHPHIGFLMVRSSRQGPVVFGARGVHHLRDGRIEGEDPLEGFSANAPAHLRRADGFEHAPDIIVNSFYDPELEQGCAFEELISFHGGLGGPQTRPFVLHPVELAAPESAVVGAEAVHELLAGWRRALEQQSGASEPLQATSS